MPFNRVRIEGRLGAEGERWSVGCAFMGPGGDAMDDPDMLGGWCNEILAQLDINPAFSGGLKNMIGVTSNFDRVSAYYYPAPGLNATASGESTLPPVAGSGAVILPYQSALVATLQTGRPGRSYRGRMYWPFVTASMTNGKIATSSTTLAARALQVASLLDSIGEAASEFPGLRPVVVSVAESVVTPVTSVRVGDIMDTQRRRRDSLVESFGTAAIPA